MDFSIDEATAQERMHFFQKKCREKGLRQTPQKKEIYKVLVRTDSHPTAQEIYEAVKQIFPDISFATVYKNLALFCAHDMIQELDFGEGCSRYDALLSHHHHVYNTKDKTVRDVFLEEEQAIPVPQNIDPGSVTKTQITYFL